MGARGAGADIGDVVRTAIEPLAGQSGRVQVDGPSVHLSPRAGLSLSMAVHELTMNAVKYGALSSPDGRVDVRWSVAAGPDGDKHLHLNWVERCGPAVTPPRHRGFGSRLIEQALAIDWNAEVALTYDPAGVVCTIDARLKALDDAPPFDPTL